MNGFVLAIDPGRAKCGIALLDGKGEIRERDIFPTPELFDGIKAIISRYPVEVVLLGKGTSSKTLRNPLQEILGSIKLELRDEKYTSEKARKRYLLEHPARGLERLIPSGMRLPDRPYDDYAAQIMAEEYFKEKNQPGGESYE